MSGHLRFQATISALRALGFEVDPQTCTVLVRDRDVPVEEIAERGLASILEGAVDAARRR